MATLEKVQKKISRKRNGAIDSLHVNSRDSRKLHRATVRDQKLGKIAAARSRREQPFLDRAEYFKDAVEEKGGEPLGLETVHELVRIYIGQSEEELSELKKQRRPGRPPTAREELLRFKMATLETEYQQRGFYMPDMTTAENIALLSRWDGSAWPYLANVAWMKVTAAGQVRPASFPPSGNNGIKS